VEIYKSNIVDSLPTALHCTSAICILFDDKTKGNHGTLEDDSAVLYKTRSLDSTNPNPKLTIILGWSKMRKCENDV